MNNISELMASIVVAFVSATFTFLGFWRKAKADLEQEYLRTFNSKKWEVYTEFTKLLQNLLADKSTDLPGLEQQPEEIALASQLVLIGSDEVVRRFRDWRETSTVYGKSQKETREKLFVLVATMRNDLGIKHSKLEIEDLLGALKPGLTKP
jgi:hypothetical protein